MVFYILFTIWQHSVSLHLICISLAQYEIPSLSHIHIHIRTNTHWHKHIHINRHTCTHTSAGPDGVPAIFLKRTKTAISKPLALLLRKSIDEGKIPEIFKMAYVTPIYKGGSK